MSAILWAAAGAVLAAIEVMMPGYFLIVPALAAIVTATATAIGLLPGLADQLICLAVAASLIFAAAFRPYRRFTAQNPPLIVNLPDRLVGAHGVVVEPIRDGRGKVRIADSVWLASGPELAAGAPVEIVSITGTVVTVAVLEPARSSPPL